MTALLSLLGAMVGAAVFLGLLAWAVFAGPT